MTAYKIEKDRNDFAEVTAHGMPYNFDDRLGKSRTSLIRNLPYYS